MVKSYGTVRVFLVHKLSCKVLLGKQLLKAHELSFVWGRIGDVNCLVDPDGDEIALNTNKQASRLRIARAYTTSAVTVLPGEGLDIPIHTENCPIRTWVSSAAFASG